MVDQPDIRTQGKVISRLAPIADFFENLIFLGRLEQVWQRLVDKAELSHGERVVDVGCGTGKVPIVSASLVLPCGEVFWRRCLGRDDRDGSAKGAGR